MEIEVATQSSGLHSRERTEAKPQEQGGGFLSKLLANQSCPSALQYGCDYLKKGNTNHYICTNKQRETKL